MIKKIVSRYQKVKAERAERAAWIKEQGEFMAECERRMDEVLSEMRQNRERARELRERMDDFRFNITQSS